MNKKNSSSQISAAEIANFPQHNLPDPFWKLQTLGHGEHDEAYESVTQRILSGDADQGAATLLKMILDETYYDYDTEEYEEGEGGDPRGWTPYNALRVLGRLGKAGEIGIMPLLPLLIGEDEYVVDELPFYFGQMGEAAFEPIVNVLLDASEDSWKRAGASEALSEIVQKRPELRDKALAAFEMSLEVAEEEPETISAIIVALLDIKAVELYSKIEEAFRLERVDEIIVQLRDVQEHFGMPVTAPKKSFGLTSNDYEFDDKFSPEQWEAAKADVLSGRSGDWPVDDSPPSVPFIAEAKPGRNEPCSCGSGKKYKKCCGA